MRIFLLILLCALPVSAHTLLCPYMRDTRTSDGLPLAPTRTLVLKSLQDALQAEGGRIDSQTVDGQGTHGLGHAVVLLDASPAMRESALLLGCQEITLRDAQTRIRAGFIKPVYDRQTDTIAVPESGGTRVIPQENPRDPFRTRTGLLRQIWQTGVALARDLLSPRRAWAQIVHGILDNFNRADEDPLSGGGNWGGSIDTDDTVALEITTNTVKKGTGAGAGGTSYWTVAPFTSPEVFLAMPDALGADGNYAGVYFVTPATVHTATPDGYFCRYIDRVGASSHDWELYRIDDGVLTEIGSATTNTIAHGDVVRCENIDGSLRLQQCTSGVCTTRNSATDGIYTDPFSIGMGVHSTNLLADDFGGGSLSTRIFRRPLVWWR